jgi:hypothetical protein
VEIGGISPLELRLHGWRRDKGIEIKDKGILLTDRSGKMTTTMNLYRFFLFFFFFFFFWRAVGYAG